MQRQSEEDYLKAILHLSNGKSVSTNELAKHLGLKASSITDMIKKLAEKKLVMYQKYHGVTLSENGKKIALQIIRKHRLWETFLVDHLHFRWDEVHEIAEQLEHIKSPELTNRLDNFMGNPKYDPHGDPIPTKNGMMEDTRTSFRLSNTNKGNLGRMIGVDNTSSDFLQHLENIGLILGTEIKVIEKFEFDNSFRIRCNGKEMNISDLVAHNIILELENGKNI